MTDIPVPAPKAIRDLLSDLFGREVEVALRELDQPRLDPHATVASYRDDARSTVAVVVADLPLAVNLAATLALANPNVAAEIAAAGTLPDDYAENVREVLNIVGTLFNSTSRAVRFDGMHAPGMPVPSRVETLASSPGRRLDLTVTIHGYGSGTMSVVVR